MTTPAESAHSKRSPSAANGWLNCLGYIQANDGIFDGGSEPAAEGTVAHEISDFCFTLDMTPHDFIGQITRYPYVERIRDPKTGDWIYRNGVWVFEWEEDDADLLFGGIDRIRQAGGQFFGEHKVNLTEWLGPDQFGTLDRGIILQPGAKLGDKVYPNGLIWIDDLKWGRGVPVSPIKNWQLMLYALGFWWNIARHITNATDILISIDQPRCPGGGGEWMTTLDELLKFGDWVKSRVAEADSYQDPPRTATEKGCFWCKARLHENGGCSTFDEYQLALVSAKFDDIDEAIEDDNRLITLPASMTPERRAYIIRHKAQFVKWMEDLHANHVTDCRAGLPGGGLKLVEGRKSPDKWRDKEQATAALEPLIGEKRFNIKLITPTQCRKIINKDQAETVRELIIEGDRKPALVPIEDERPALPTAQDKFDEEADEG